MKTKFIMLSAIVIIIASISCKSTRETKDSKKGSYIEITGYTEMISPNGDNKIDSLAVKQNGSEGDWEIKITSITDGMALYEKEFNGMPDAEFKWDAKDSSGNTISNGKYKYMISLAGSDDPELTKEAVFEVKNMETPVSLIINKNIFSPYSGNLELTPSIKVKEDFINCKLDILDQNGVTVKTISSFEIPEYFQWNGTDSQEVRAADGYYTAKMTAYYKFGNEPEASTAKFLLKYSPPDISVSMGPELFSPDADGNNDILTINITSNKDPYGIGLKEWNLSILSPDKKNVFMSYSGKTYPEKTIKWNGKNRRGILVDGAEDYPVKIFAVDNLGNILDMMLDPVSTDILIIKLADGRLKIMMKDVLFKADSAVMIDEEKTRTVLKKLADKMNKYENYRLTVVGHVNRFMRSNGTYEKELGEHLSEDRARFIADILIEDGLDSARIKTVGKGGSDPAVYLRGRYNHMYLAQNRRVEFFLEK